MLSSICTFTPFFSPSASGVVITYSPVARPFVICVKLQLVSPVSTGRSRAIALAFGPGFLSFGEKDLFFAFTLDHALRRNGQDVIQRRDKDLDVRGHPGFQARVLFAEIDPDVSGAGFELAAADDRRYPSYAP